MILKELSLVRLRFELETLEESNVPAYKGDLLRMALLWWLSDFWCPMPNRCRHGCRQPQVCMFGRLCEPPVDPTWSPKILRMMGDTPPPAYTLWDMQDRRRHMYEGTAWRFELVLVGELALRQIPAVVAAVQQGAEKGMGRVRLRSRVRRVAALRDHGAPEPAECHLAVEKPAGDSLALTWQSYRLEDVVFGYEQALRWVQSYCAPVRALSLRYLSPVKIKERGQWVEEPHFRPVMRAVVRRLRLLSQVHGAGEWPQAQYGPLLDLAETVRMEHHETHWVGYTRQSKRSGRHEIEGFIGQAWYAGEDLRPLLPALWLGQWLHVGKSYVLGNGRYLVEQIGQ